MSLIYELSSHCHHCLMSFFQWSIITITNILNHYFHVCHCSSGLQFLLCKIHKLQEEGCELPISGMDFNLLLNWVDYGLSQLIIQFVPSIIYYIFRCYIVFFFLCPIYLLEPIISLASSWQKVEFESWPPTLLDEVQDQYELNARKVGIVWIFCSYEQKYRMGSTNFFFLVAVVTSFVFCSPRERLCWNFRTWKWVYFTTVWAKRYCGSYICIFASIRSSKRYIWCS